MGNGLGPRIVGGWCRSVYCRLDRSRACRESTVKSFSKVFSRDEEKAQSAASKEDQGRGGV